MRKMINVIMENGFVSDIGDNVHYSYKNESKDFVGEILAIFQTKRRYIIIMENDMDDSFDDYKYSVIEYEYGNYRFIDMLEFEDLESAKKYFKSLI